MNEIIDLEHPTRGQKAFLVIFGIIFALFGVLFLLVSFDVFHILAIIPLPRLAAAAFGSIFVLIGIWIMFEGVTSRWGRHTPLYQWMNLGLTIILVLAFTSFWFVFWLEVGAGQPDRVWSGIFVGVFCGLFLLFLLVHTIVRVRKLLGKKPAQAQDQENDK